MNSKIIAVTLLIFILTACSPTSGDSSYQLIILKEKWDDLDLGYEAEQAQAILSDEDTSDNLFVIGVGQIEEYDWDLQTITLTKQATIDLANALATQGSFSNNDVKKLQELKENLGWGNPIERALYTSAFVVKVNGEFRYGGIFLDAISQMGINYPVIRVTITNGKATLALLPIHIPFVMVDPIDSDDNVRDAPIANETRSDIQQLDIFSDVLIKFARRDTATEFRGLIHDDDIKQILESAKILKNNLNIE